ncbi:MAG: hypothetical protein JNM17_24915 [Archangium sp.]|nr:hypothetical protein [Archangium sp.]
MKWNANAFEPRNLLAFRASYPKGHNWLVSAQTSALHTREVAGLVLHQLGIEGLRAALS